MPAPEEAVLIVLREWLIKAENDLTAASQILKMGKAAPMDTICFHAQQCVEKYIKAILVHRAIPVPRIHDIPALMKLVPPTARPGLTEDEQKQFTNYAVVTRYPDAGLEISWGWPREGMSGRAIARRFGRVERFHLIGRTGFVSDDTEQAALVAQCLARHPDDVEGCVRAFRRALLGWFCRLPWGVGRATIRACERIGLRLERSGVMSAGNGAAMRAAIVGTFFDDQPAKREKFGRALAEVTHRDPRAVEGALYVAELAAACARSASGTRPAVCQEQARRIVTVAALGEAIDRARDLALQGVSTREAAESCGTWGFVLHSVSFATFGLLRYGFDPFLALTEVISAGGDTDSTGAILGGWLGALYGEPALPRTLIERIHDGPFGPTHLRDLAGCLARIRDDPSTPVPRYSPTRALARNLTLYPVAIGHGFRRLLPF